jgi:serine/threonine protein kinase
MTRSAKLLTTSGYKVSMGSPIAYGGQGEIREAILSRDNIKGVVKLFKKSFRTPSTRRRIEFLINAKLSQSCPVIRAPTDLIASNGDLGHFTPFAPGISLEKKLQTGDITLIQAIQMALALARAIEVLHEQDISNGDLHSDNVLVESGEGDVLVLHLIDLDNFGAPGQPLPDMIGQSLYLAPEQRIAISRGEPAIPDIFTDRFSLGVLIHEMLLLKHPATGSDDDEASFQQAMSKGRWLHDPGNGGSLLDTLGGYPSGIVGPDLCRLFRRSISLERDTRPTPTEWKTSLQSVLNSVYVCPHCSGTFIADPYSFACSHCKQSFPALRLHTLEGSHIILNQAAVAIGRENIGGDQTVSARHAIFRRRGSITYVESRGRNGTSRWDGTDWIQLQENSPIVVKDGDKLRLGSFEVQLRGAP